MREEIKYQKVVNFEENEIIFLDYVFYDKLNGSNFCGAVGSYISLLTKEECDVYKEFNTRIEEPSLNTKEEIEIFLKDKKVEYHKMLYSSGGRIFNEYFNGNVSKELNDAIFMAEVADTL